MRDDTPLGDAREWLQRKIRNGGTHCPCCNQFAKVYKRQINSVMARALITMYKHSGLSFVHAPTLFERHTGDFGKLVYWDLIREATTPREDGGRAGWWRVTKTGRAFIRRKIEVPKYALIYDAGLLGFDESKWVDIQDCLGTRFNLSELMRL